MKKYGVPADFKSSTIDEYDRLNKAYNDSCIFETYGQVTVGNSIESGRAGELIPKIDIVDLAEYIAYCKSRNIDFNYTMNASYMGNREFTKEGIKEIKNFLDTLYNVGVRSITVALPSLMELIHQLDYDFKLRVSTICQVVNPNMALQYKKYNPDRIVVGESINRDFKMLKRITQAYGDNIEVVTNSICHINCVNRMFHYNEASGDTNGATSESSTSYYPNRCMYKRYETPESFLKLSWIRPEDIKYYTSVGINYFKIQGRQMVLRGNPVKLLESYFEESFDGNLLDLLEMFSDTNPFRINVDNKKLDGFIKPYYESDFCHKECDKCGYCKKVAEKSISVGSNNAIMSEAKAYYTEHDAFTQLINEVKAEESESKDFNALDIDFEI